MAKLTQWYYDSAMQSPRDSDTFSDQTKFKIALSTIAEAYGFHHSLTVLYLLQNGFSQQADVYANERAEMRKKAGLGKGHVDTPAIKAKVEELRKKRLDALLAGTMTPNYGEGRDPIKTVAREMLEDFLLAKGKPGLSKDKAKADANNKMIEIYLGAHRELVEKEMARRAATKAKVSTATEADADWLEAELKKPAAPSKKEKAV